MRKILAVAALGVAMTAAPAFAQTDSDDMLVTAEVINNCTITAGTMDFGQLTVINGTNHDTSTNVDLVCTPGASYSITMDQGTSGSRTMSDGTNGIPYELYSDSGYSSVWGTGATAIAGTATTGTVNLTAYGRIPSTAANVPASVYNDTVTVEVTF